MVHNEFELAGKSALPVMLNWNSELSLKYHLWHL